MWGDVRMRPKLRVLIVEDDRVIAEMTKDVLVANNFQVCGIAATCEDATFLARLIKPDIALIDLGLANDEQGTDVAARLRALTCIGILYTTGNVAGEWLVRAVGEGRLIKPYSCDDLLRAIDIVAEIVATGATSGPYPETFRRLGTIA